MIELIGEIRTEAEVVRAHRHLLSQQKRKLSHLLRAGEAGICRTLEERHKGLAQLSMENGNGVDEKPFEGQAKDGAHKFIMEPSNVNMQFSPERLSRTELETDKHFCLFMPSMCQKKAVLRG